MAFGAGPTAAGLQHLQQLLIRLLPTGMASLGLAARLACSLFPVG
jgi:hypothetical protein